jgi:hypothetical protein
MTISQRLSLMWRRFAPLEERLLAAVREVLPPQAQVILDAQIAGVTFVQRLPPHWLEISFHRKRHGKVDWSDIPMFPRSGEFRLAEVQFTVGGQRHKSTLTSIGGHGIRLHSEAEPEGHRLRRLGFSAIYPIAFLTR